MPVHGRDVGGRRKRQAPERTAGRPKRERDQSDHASQQMQRVRHRENVEEAAARIRSEEEPLSAELEPSDDLPDEKKDSQDCCDRPPMAEARIVSRAEALARVDERETAA